LSLSYSAFAEDAPDAAAPNEVTAPESSETNAAAGPDASVSPSAEIVPARLPHFEQASYPGEARLREHFFGIHAAILAHWSYDERFSPLTYQSPNWGASLHYEFRGAKNHHMLSVLFGVGRAVNGFGDRVTFINGEDEKETLAIGRLQVQGALNYAYHRALFTSESAATKFYLGAILDAYVNIMSSLEFNWLAAYSLNASAQLTTDLAPQHFLAFRFYLPFLTYLCRPPWSIYDDPVMDAPEWTNAFRGRITSLNQYIRVTADLRYEYALTDTWRLSLIYALWYFFTDVPTRMYASSSNVLVGVTAGLGGSK
jgi:hypothetical protein